MSVSQAHDQSPLPASETGKTTGKTSTIGGTLSALWREPLIHFCLLGGLIFAVDHVMHPPGQDAKTIVVTKAMQQSFFKNFSEDGDQDPTEEQMKNMIDNWVGSEILYREGKALGIEKGDSVFRDRIAFKLQLLVFDQVQLEKPSDAQLHAHFEKYRNRFDQPEQVSFLLTPATDEATARRQFEDMKAERETSELRDQTRVFPNRPVNTLAQSFGENFRTALLALPPGEWRVIQAKDGWRIARLDAHRAAEPVNFESVREDVRKMWVTDETRRRAWEAVNRLKLNYTVKIEQ